jgi:hypothetical protein
MSNFEDHEREQDELTEEWEELAEAYVAAAYGQHPHHETYPDLDFQVHDDGAFVTIRIWVPKP